MLRPLPKGILMRVNRMWADEPIDPEAPVAVIDSGLGGLTVVRAIRAAVPGENVVYFGDTARLPYGGKSASAVTAFVTQVLAFLRPAGPKHVVVACNTATALALPAVRAAFPNLSISGVIEPGARAAIEAAGTKLKPLIAVLATEATVRSKAYGRAVARRRHYARVLSIPAPLLVPIIEDGRGPDDPMARLAVAEYIRPLRARKPDVLILGCTHYPVYRDLIARALGPDCTVIDSAQHCAQDVARRLIADGLLRATMARGSLRSFVTDDPAKFQRLAPRFLGEPIDQPTLVPLGQLIDGEPETVRQLLRRAG
jgi:glutamate racemase